MASSSSVKRDVENTTNETKLVVRDGIDNENNTKSFSYYKELHKAVIRGDWNSIEAFLRDNPEGIRAKINNSNETPLHLAVFSLSAAHLRNLLAQMSPHDLEIPNCVGETALHKAAIDGKLEVTELLVDKNSKLPNRVNDHGVLPLEFAFYYTVGSKSKELVRYLIKATDHDAFLTPDKGPEFVCRLIQAQFVDVALEVLHRPRAAEIALYSLWWNPLAQFPAVLFPSATHYNILERLIYKYCSVDGSCRSPVSGPQTSAPATTRFGYLPLLWHKSYELLWIGTAKLVPRIKEIKDAKELHRHSLRLVELLCKKISQMNDENSRNILESTVMTAAERGIHEIIEELLLADPALAWSIWNDTGLGIFHSAVEYRWHNVFNLLFQMSQNRKEIYQLKSKKDASNILHEAAKLPSQDRLNQVAGAALQMQRELQWYKAVENFSLPFQYEERNAAGKVPAVLFTEEHEKLVENGEKWMRDTANSCTISAALVATIAFAAATATIPHTNGEALFRAFTILNALSLFSSVSSLSIFLSMLTTRYAQKDFLYSLPKRLILGLSILSISVTTMIATFTMVLFLMSEKINMRILGPLVGCAGVPVAFFVFSQFPLLVDMISSTYGRGIFRKQGDRILF